MMKTVLTMVLVLGMSLTAVRAGEAEDLYARGVKILHEKNVGGIDEALVLFERAAATNATFDTAYQGMADALILKFEFAEAKNPALLKKALGYLDKVLELRPGNAKAYFSKATACFDLGEERDGMANLRKSLVSDPANLEANVAYFGRLLVQKENDKAVEFAAASVEKVTNRVDLLKLYGHGFSQAGLQDAAIDTYRKAAKLAPRNAVLRYALGDAFRARGKYEQAIGAYEDALKIDGKLVQAHFRLGYCWAALQDFGKAAAATQKYLESEPDDIAALNNLAMYLEKLNRMDEAKAIWQKIQNLPSASDVHRTRAAAHLSSPVPPPKE